MLTHALFRPRLLLISRLHRMGVKAAATSFTTNFLTNKRPADGPPPQGVSQLRLFHACQPLLETMETKTPTKREKRESRPEYWLHPAVKKCPACKKKFSTRKAMLNHLFHPLTKDYCCDRVAEILPKDVYIKLVTERTPKYHPNRGW